MEVKLLDLVAQYDKIRSEIEDAVREVMESQYFIMGPKVAGFERSVATYCGVEYAAGAASGSDAILLALMALDIGPGDEVFNFGPHVADRDVIGRAVDGVAAERRPICTEAWRVGSGEHPDT